MRIDFTPFWFLFSLGTQHEIGLTTDKLYISKYPQIMSSPAVKDTTRFSHAHPHVWTLNPGTLLCTKSQAKQLPFFLFFFAFSGGDFRENWFHPPSGPTTEGEVGSCQEMDGLATEFFYWSYCEKSILDAHVHDECRKGRNNKELESCRSGRFFFIFFLSFFHSSSSLGRRTHDSLLLLLLLPPTCLPVCSDGGTNHLTAGVGPQGS